MAAGCALCAALLVVPVKTGRASVTAENSTMVSYSDRNDEVLGGVVFNSGRQNRVVEREYVFKMY